MDRSQTDKIILQRAVNNTGKPITPTPYNGISIKEALKRISYPAKRLDIRA